MASNHKQWPPVNSNHKKAAQMAIFTLATQGAEEAGVEAADTNQTASGNTATDDFKVVLTLLVIFLFSFIGTQNVAYKAYRWFLNIVQVLFPQPVMENESTIEEMR